MQTFRSTHPLPGTNRALVRPTSQCVISFGSNLGDRHELVAEAAREISRRTDLLDQSELQTSRLFETPPIGGPGGQEPFLNAVGVFQTSAPARRILDGLQEVESKLGRQRRLRWDSRSIDLDVVLHGNLMGGATGLVVPHPRYTARQFVLRPACDVAGQFRDPRFGWTLAELSAFLADDTPSLALATGSRELRERLCERLEQQWGITIRQSPDFGRTTEHDCWVASSFDERLSHQLDLRRRNADNQDGGLEGFPNRLRGMPRLLVRIQHSDPNRWPAPHQMWPRGWNWPEYRLEVEDFDWAVSELASALQSMQCDANPVSRDGRWW